MEIWNHATLNTSKKGTPHSAVPEVVSLNDLMRLEEWEGTRYYERQRLFCYLIRRFSQLEKGGEKKHWWELDTRLLDYFRDSMHIKEHDLIERVSRYTHTTYNALAVNWSRHIPLLMCLIFQQCCSVSFNRQQNW